MFWNTMKKKEITEEEYVNACERLAFIDSERNNLKEGHENNVYNAHINLPGTFDELKINLQRKNFRIDQEINALKNKYLGLYNDSENVRTIIEQCLTLLEIKCSTPLEKKEDAFFKTLNPKFESFIKEAEDLLSHKYGHSILLQYILKLEEEEKECRKIKSLYEKQGNKKSSFFRR